MVFQHLKYTQTVFELQLQYVRGGGRVFWVLGHLIEVSWSVALEKKKKSYTFSRIEEQPSETSSQKKILV